MEIQTENSIIFVTRSVEENAESSPRRDRNTESALSPR